VLRLEPTISGVPLVAALLDGVGLLIYLGTARVVLRGTFL
jgi:Mg/Co/Ni transporter MgtE